MIPLTQDDEFIYINNSLLDDYRRCPLGCFYRNCWGARLSSNTPATYFGTQWHQCMHALWGSHTELPWDIQRAMLKTNDYDPAMEDEKGRSQLRLRSALTDYYQYKDLSTEESYEETATEALTLMAEEFISYPILKWEDKTVLYCGTIDRVFSLKDQTYIMDYKTTSLNWMQEHKWAESPQFKGYLWLISKVAPSFTTMNFIIDFLMLQSKTNNKFVRRYLNFEPWMLKEWEEDTKKLILRLLIDNHPEKYSNCSDFKGCPYTMLCRQPPEYRAEIAQNYYKIEPWDMSGKAPTQPSPLEDPDGTV